MFQTRRSSRNNPMNINCLFQLDDRLNELLDEWKSKRYGVKVVREDFFASIQVIDFSAASVDFILLSIGNRVSSVPTRGYNSPLLTRAIQ